MVTSEEATRFFEDIAEDFFAECDELLSVIRRSLLRIDDLKGMQKPEKNVLEDLLRSCHTLKGITGMVGAGDVMKLTHSIENYLKAVYQGSLVIPPGSLDKLISGVRMIERQLNALRKKESMPGMADIIGKIDGLLSEQEAGNLSETDTAQLIRSFPGEGEATQEQDYIPDEKESVWKFYFTPDKDLFQKGININTVRERLQNIGKVIGSMPVSTENGSITFEFSVVSEEPESLFRSWASEGIRYQRIKKGSPFGITYKEKEEKAAESARVSTQPEHKALKNIVRVDLSRLDDIMKTVGDLVVSRARLSDHLASMEHDRQHGRGGLHETNILMERQLRELRENIMKLRLVPIGEAFERMRFVVRDLIRESSKSVNVEMSGQDTQIDKYIMERMFDPLLHLVRNSVSHGIEPPEERLASGKPAQGRILLKASAAGDSVVFIVEDDGRGIDRKVIIEKGIAKGIIDHGQHADDMVLNLMCTPGFSTRDETDMASGRGMGMDVVKKTIRELGGNLAFETDEGNMTRFIIRLPLTLSIVDALIVTCGKYIFAVPMPVVTEVARFRSEDLVSTENYELISYRDTVLPVIRLSRFFHLDTVETDSFDCMITGQRSERVAVAVDRIKGKREIVVRTLSDPLVKVDGISGATELGDGRIVLILDIQTLISSAMTSNRISSTNI